MEFLYSFFERNIIIYIFFLFAGGGGVGLLFCLLSVDTFSLLLTFWGHRGQLQARPNSSCKLYHFHFYSSLHVQQHRNNQPCFFLFQFLHFLFNLHHLCVLHFRQDDHTLFHMLNHFAQKLLHVSSLVSLKTHRSDVHRT